MQSFIKLEVKFRKKVSSAAHLSCFVLKSRDFSVLRGVKNTQKETFYITRSFKRIELLFISHDLISCCAMFIESNGSSNCSLSEKLSSMLCVNLCAWGLIMFGIRLSYSLRKREVFFFFDLSPRSILSMKIAIILSFNDFFYGYWSES